MRPTTVKMSTQPSGRVEATRFGGPAVANRPRSILGPGPDEMNPLSPLSLSSANPLRDDRVGRCPFGRGITPQTAEDPIQPDRAEGAEGDAVQGKITEDQGVVGRADDQGDRGHEQVDAL